MGGGEREGGLGGERGRVRERGTTTKQPQSEDRDIHLNIYLHTFDFVGFLLNLSTVS